MLALTGESGQGKSWLAMAMLKWLAEKAELVIAVDASGDAERDLDRVSTGLWNGVLGHDTTLPFGRIRARFREVDPLLAGRPVYALIDGVRDRDELRGLARESLDEWSLRLLVTCSRDAAAGVSPCRSEPVPDFDVGALQVYLARRVGRSWIGIPDDVRSTLKRPLLARLYCEMCTDGDWVPTREYELYERVWNRLREAGARRHPMDSVLLAKAACRLTEGAPYPWTAEQLCDNWNDDSFIRRLIDFGWLVPGDDGYRVWHDRLLCWAAAEGVVADLRAGRMDVGTMAGRLSHLGTRAHPHSWLLRYVQMDVLWLLTRPESADPVTASAVASVLRAVAPS